jgi:hypothetical protein
LQEIVYENEVNSKFKISDKLSLISKATNPLSFKNTQNARLMQLKFKKKKIDRANNGQGTKKITDVTQVQQKKN